MDRMKYLTPPPPQKKTTHTQKKTQTNKHIRHNDLQTNKTCIYSIHRYQMEV